MGWMEELKSPGALQSAFAEHGPRAATVLLAALVAIQAGLLVTAQDHFASGQAAVVRGAASGAVAGTGRPALRVTDIVAAHLFGEAAPVAADGSAPQTAVQLVLAGVLAVPDPRRGLAIIGPSATAARLYAVGSAVPGGVKLYSVYPDHVLLDRDGSIESLQLPKKVLASTPPPPLASGVSSPGQRLAALAQGNGALLGGLVRATPVISAGKLSGFRIFPGGRASIASFTQLGLRPGDLVTAVNGTQLDDVNRGNEILQTLSSSSSATLTVQRNGQPQDLNLNLETVVSEAENAAAQSSAAARRGGAFGGPAAGSGMGRVPGMAGSVAAPGLLSPAPAPANDGSTPPPPPPEAAPESTPNDQ
jgi:general secretion pathway protein C